METYILEGNISVKAAILAGKRKVFKLYVDRKKKDKDTTYILHRAKERHIPITYTSREEIDEIASGKTHGGLIAVCGPRSYDSLEKLLPKKELFLALAEGVEDPFNFGSILRTLYAAGCDGVLVGKRNWSSAAGVVGKASAGASEYINLIEVEDMETCMKQLQKHNVHIVCAMRSDAISLYDYTFPKRFLIAIGGEMRGLSKPVLQHSDQNLYIPYRSDFRNALGAAASTAIFGFEIVRQKETYYEE